MTRRLLFLFLDGVGLGEAEPSFNPFAATATPNLEAVLGAPLLKTAGFHSAPALVFQSLDARLGIEGLPQSATGQTALLTGKNGAEIMARHYGPWPGPTLKEVLEEGTLFSEVLQAEKRVTFANAYPPEYFRALERGKQKQNVPVYAAQAAGLSLHGLKSYRAGQAIGADLTGAYLHAQDASYPLYTAFEAGQKLAEIAGAQHLTFFDFWLSDQAGHRWDFVDALELVSRLDSFIGGVLKALADTTLLITSDHGNLEDKRVKTHTLADVPLIAVGPGAAQFADCHSLLDIAPAVRTLLGLHGTDTQNLGERHPRPSQS